jgi:hypothetical protein
MQGLGDEPLGHASKMRKAAKRGKTKRAGRRHIRGSLMISFGLPLGERLGYCAAHEGVVADSDSLRQPD